MSKAQTDPWERTDVGAGGCDVAARVGLARFRTKRRRHSVPPAQPLRFLRPNADGGHAERSISRIAIARRRHSAQSQARRLRKRRPEWEGGAAGVGAPMLCLCTTLGQDGLTARLLVVRGGSGGFSGGALLGAEGEAGSGVSSDDRLLSVASMSGATRRPGQSWPRTDERGLRASPRVTVSSSAVGRTDRFDASASRVCYGICHGRRIVRGWRGPRTLGGGG
jgi:hypothetical protein